jgi:spermidine synthase
LPSLLIIKLIFSLIVVLPPTILFGAVWPFINRYYIKDLNELGSGTGNLYSANSMGSALGAFAGGFIFVPFLGFMGTSVIAALFNIVAGLLLIRRGRG